MINLQPKEDWQPRPNLVRYVGLDIVADAAQATTRGPHALIEEPNETLQFVHRNRLRQAS